MSTPSPLPSNNELYVRLLNAKNGQERTEIIAGLKKLYDDNVGTTNEATATATMINNFLNEIDQRGALDIYRRLYNNEELRVIAKLLSTSRVPKLVFNHNTLTPRAYREFFVAIRQSQQQMLVVFNGTELNNETVEILLKTLLHDNPNPPDIIFSQSRVSIENTQNIRQALNQNSHDSIDQFTVLGDLDNSINRGVSLSLHFFPGFRTQPDYSDMNSKRKASTEASSERALISVGNDAKCKLDLEGFSSGIRTMLQDNPSLTALNLSHQTPTPLNNNALLLSPLLDVVAGERCLHITRLSLIHVEIADNQCKLLADALRTNRTLTMLELRDNSINSEGAKALAEACSHQTSNRSHQTGSHQTMGSRNSTLQSLVLSGNEIGKEGFEALAHMLSCNSSLTSLSCGYRNDDSQGAIEESFAGGIRHNNTLTSLDDVGLENKEIRERLKRNKQLQARMTGLWSHIAPLIAFVRSNNSSALRTSIIPLLPHFTRMNQTPMERPGPAIDYSPQALEAAFARIRFPI